MPPTFRASYVSIYSHSSVKETPFEPLRAPICRRMLQESELPLVGALEDKVLPYNFSPHSLVLGGELDGIET